MSDDLKLRLVSGAGSALLKSLFRSSRIRLVGDDSYKEIVASGKPVIYALWHGRLLAPTYVHRNQNITALISQSKDGEYIARVVLRWGYQTARGSSTRGGSGALREMVRSLRQGNSITFTPDGPRGPRQKLKPGTLLAAQVTGAPIIPVSAAATHAWWFEGWDRFLVPRPFSTIYVGHGKPIYVARDANEDQLRAAEAEVEAALNAITTEVDGYVDSH